METISKAAFVAASLFAANIVLGQTQPATPAMTVRLGNITAGDTQAAATDKFAELLTQYSGGRLKASAHHGGSLGGIPQMLPSLQAGSVHGTIQPANLFATAVPELGLFSMPFLIPNATPANMTAFAAQSKAAAKMMQLAEQKGIHIIGFHGIASSNFLTKFPVNKLADIQGKKFYVSTSPQRVGTYQDWGAVARTLPFGEAYTALQQGTVDGSEFVPDIAYKMKFHEVTKYYTLTGHAILLSALIVSKKWFDGLPKDLQNVVTRAGKDTIAWTDDAYTKTQASSLEALRKAITVTDMPAAEIQKMKDLTRKGVWERMKNDPQTGSLLKVLEEEAARFARK